MSSHSDDRPGSQVRTYDRSRSVVFLKTREEWGGLSNMAGGFPLSVCGIHILTAEALYQACRFPNQPAVQRLITEQASPMAAKMKSKPFRVDTRRDWDQVRVKVMRWCLHVKLAQNWATFSELLAATGDRPIVEESHRDPFWGAKAVDAESLVGMNVLGRLLMELRDEARNAGREGLWRVGPLSVSDFLLDAKPIGEVSGDDIVHSARAAAGSFTASGARRSPPQARGRRRTSLDQISLSDWLLPEDEE